MKITIYLCGLLLLSTVSAQFQFTNSAYKNKDLDWMGMITFDEEMIDVQKLYADEEGHTYVMARFQWDMHLGVPAQKKKDPEPPKVSAEDSYGYLIQKIAPDQSIVFTKVIKLGDRKQADMTSSLFNVINDLTIVGSDIYITGSFEFKADFGQNITLISSGRNDMFTAKIDGNGNTTWAIQGGGIGKIYAEMDPGGMAVTADPSGENVYAVAVLNAYPNGGGMLDGKPLELSKHGATMVLMKITKDGKVLWFKKAPAGTGGSNQDMMLDGDGNIYISGASAFFIEWDGNKKDVNGMRDGFILKLDSEGNYIWAKTMGYGDGAFDGKTLDNETISNMNIDSNGNVALMASFYNGAKIEGNTVIKPKASIVPNSNVLMTLDSEGNITSFHQFDGKNFLDMPTNAFQGNNGELLFRLGGKAKMNGEKVKELGYYSLKATGEISFVYNPTYSSPAYLFIAAGIQKTNNAMYMLGKLKKTSEFVADYSGALAGAMMEKKINKTWVYKRDLDIGLLLLKLNID